MILLCGSLFVACEQSDDNEDEPQKEVENSINIMKLLGYTYYMHEDDFEYPRNYSVTFKNIVFASFSINGRDLTDEGWETWDLGSFDCIYKVVGNKLIIYYDNFKGVQREYVMNFKNGEPEGWSRSDKNIYDDYDDIPSMMDEYKSMYPEIYGFLNAQEGDPSIYGFYLSNGIENILGTNFRSMVACGDTNEEGWNECVKSENELLYRGSIGYLITDGNTIHSVYGGATRQSGKANGKVFMTKSYHVGNKTYTIYYYYITDYYAKSYKYVMNGEKLWMSNGNMYVLRGGKMFCAGYDENGKFTELSNASYTKQ